MENLKAKFALELAPFHLILKFGIKIIICSRVSGRTDYMNESNCNFFQYLYSFVRCDDNALFDRRVFLFIFFIYLPSLLVNTNVPKTPVLSIAKVKVRRSNCHGMERFSSFNSQCVCEREYIFLVGAVSMYWLFDVNSVITQFLPQKETTKKLWTE